ncbi:M20 metallopeptidase family protein [Amycolatopsis sp. CB00013]|uniref:M20 metallopeptidase family protein n=1 Tax=Amycolatopsis sp. CB00013 TaxID=1703945 RepID=UPI00093B5890|nr:M20 family metallopeptidase [Amycolatopsis sp. CB00013]OKJ91189.1 N-acyl-L-amino acid amidohydrolase [Amycolatopsis sp. CB00013]
MTELDELQDRWEAAVEAELPSAIGLRHRVHADPRASGDEEDTARVVVEALDIDDGVRVAKTGRAVLLPGTRPGPAVALRTELDALPVTERTGVPWASETPLMHACGHDVHMAALVATVRAAAVVGVPRPLVALLQPREETSPSGALDIVESGVLTEYGVESVIGAHVQPRLAAGVVSAVPGPVNASTDEFDVVVRGQGGHAGYPHLLRDPILALSQIVVSLQQLASRRVDPVFGAVCSVGRIEAGTTANVVPNEARLSGSLRLMRAEDRDLALEGLAEVVHGTAKAHGCRAELEISPCEPVLHNDAGLTQRAHRRLVRTGAGVDTDFRSFGADDFAHYCGMTRGLMMFVGLGDTAGAPSLHDELFLPPDAAIGQVASALIAGYLAAVEG